MAESEDKNAAERGLNWAIGVAYFVLIVANIWAMSSMGEAGIERKVFQAKARQTWRRLTAPLREQRQWRRDVTAMHVDAAVTVEQAANDE